MDPFVVFFAAAVAVAGAKVIASIRREDVRRTTRRAVARACGLTQILDDPERRIVTGTHGTLRVRIETPELRPRTTRVVVEGLVRSVQIVSSGTGPDRPGLVFADRDVTVGDADFDAAVLLQGPVATVRALFTASARAQARALFGPDAKIRVGGGSLIAEYRDRRGPPAPTAPQLKELLEMAHALEPGATDVTRLVGIAYADPVASVRKVALETLVREGSDLAPTHAALRDALRDPADSIRLLAATTLGDEGRPVLHALAADPSVEDPTAAAAVAALGGYMTFPRATPLLERAVTDGRPHTARALLKVMGRGSAVEARVIEAVLGRVRDGHATMPAEAAATIAAGALEALLDTGAPIAEDVFLGAIASPAAETVGIAARGLARFGTARSVPALRALEPRGGALARAAREAIVAIQARLTGATPGQISLAGGDAGQVSVVDSPDGRVTLEEEGA